MNAALVAEMVKNPPARWETWVLSLDWEDPLEKGMATHSSILFWRIPWTEKPGGLQSIRKRQSKSKISNGHEWIVQKMKIQMAFKIWQMVILLGIKEY